MTELERLQQAKLYMGKLAQGIDPISDAEIPEDFVLNQVQLARCFFYLSDVLGQLIANGGTLGGKTNQRSFSIGAEELARVQISDEPIRITRFTEHICAAVPDRGQKKLNPTVITNWLEKQGFLVKQADTDGKQRRVPSDRGLEIGLSPQLIHGQYRDYLAVFYNANAQRFLLNHLPDILAGANRS